MQNKRQRSECLSDSIRYFMEKEGITEDEFLTKCDAPNAIVKRILSGKLTNPTLDYLLLIVDALGTTAHDFFTINDLMSELSKEQAKAMIDPESLNGGNPEISNGVKEEYIKEEKNKVLPEGGRPILSEQEQGIYDLRKQGVTFEEIAKIYGLSRSRVSAAYARVCKRDAMYDSDPLYKLFCDHSLNQPLISRIMTRLKFEKVTTVEEFAEFDIYNPRKMRNLGSNCLEVMIRAQASLREKE